MHKDIIRLDDFVESYSNLTLKTLSVFSYSNERKYKTTFKVDDDSYLRLDLLWRHLKMFPDTSNLYSAHCSYDFPVNQDPESKNYMFDTYPHDSMPILCHGEGYLLGENLVKYVVENKNKLLKHVNEDVTISVWLLEENKSGPRVDLDPDLHVTFFWEECHQDSIFLNPVSPADQGVLWENANLYNDICANNFQLKVYIDMLEELSKQSELLLL